MKSLVTGGKGFIGSTLVKKLLYDYSDEVLVIDNNTSNSSNSFTTKDVTYIDHDLNDFERILPFFKDVDRVFHLAADVSIDYCNKAPRLSGINNTNTTLNVLECCRIMNIKKFIFSSTSAVYKENKENKQYKETDETLPQNTYSASKLFGENLCSVYYNLYGVQTVCLRYFNVYGPGLIASKYSSVVVKLLESQNNKTPFNIHGNGLQTRDFIHVNDVSDINIIASNTELPVYGEVFNVGCGKPTTIKVLAEILANSITYTPQRKGDIEHSCADITKLKNTFHWEPKHEINTWLKKIK